jgi:glycerol-3-phosphate dehydrogenase
VGLRPLVKPPDDDGANTKGLSREHTVLASRSGLITVTGGKWTTYRAMAEDVLEKCFEQSLLKRISAGVTTNLQLVGAAGVAASRPRICDAPGGILMAANALRWSAAGRRSRPGGRADRGDGPFCCAS